MEKVFVSGKVVNKKGKPVKKATVIVTHDQLEALTMATKIAVMRDAFKFRRNLLQL